MKRPTKAERRPATEARTVVIEAPNIEIAPIKIVGVAPYVQNKFPVKARKLIEEKQRAGSRAGKGKKRTPRNFEAGYEDAKHVSREGWLGIPAPAFRNAMISACRVVGFQMSKAKLAIFIEADGFDRDDGTPLVRINGEPHIHQAYVRNETGVVDLRWRPMWDEWSAMVRVRYDGDLFTSQDIVNLLARAGRQVGIGEGRHDSKRSNGMGWGEWEIQP